MTKYRKSIPEFDTLGKSERLKGELGTLGQKADTDDCSFVHEIGRQRCKKNYRRTEATAWMTGLWRKIGNKGRGIGEPDSIRINLVEKKDSNSDSLTIKRSLRLLIS